MVTGQMDESGEVRAAAPTGVASTKDPASTGGAARMMVWPGDQEVLTFAAMVGPARLRGLALLC